MAIRAPQPQSESSEQVSLIGCFVTLCVLVSLGFMVYHFSGTSSGDDEPSNDTWSQNTTSTFGGQPSSSFDDRGVPVTSASGSSDSIAPWPGNRDPSFLQRPTPAAQSRTNSTLEIRTFLRDRKWSPELASQIAQSTQAIQEREGLDLKPAVHRALSPFRLERPASGRAFRFQMREGVAPLRVATRIEGSQSADYFIKLVDVQSGQRVFGFYVHGGQTSETQVPLGRYEIRYAVVRDWYGPDRFGPFSSFSKADKVFAFRQDGLRITGFTIELILQVNGNLRTESIDAEDF